MSAQDIEAVQAFEASVAPPHRRFSRAEWEDVLHGYAREHGAMIRVLRKEGAIVGVVGLVTVALDRGEAFLSPFLAGDEAAGAVMDELIGIADARGARWIRASVTAAEHVARQLLASRGFTPRLAFLDLELDLAGRTFVEEPLPGLVPVPMDRAEPAAWALLHNAAFARVDNAPPLTVEQAADDLSRLPAGARLWRDDEGYAAFVVLTDDGTVDAVAVRPDLQGRGLASKILRGAAARATTPRLHSLVASTNAASLRLHERLGFVEVARRDVFQRDRDRE